ncbi:hypothetical protein PENSPDRAFT_672613, partial [Peniophora sp. CONT]
MSAVASSSDLSKQPDLTNTETKLQAYGYEHTRLNPAIGDFVKTAVAQSLRFFHNMSPVVKNLPFRTSLLDEDEPLETAVQKAAQNALVKGDRLEKITTSAKNVDLWQASVFSTFTTETRVTKARRTLVRKLRLVRDENTLHEPLAMAEQAQYFLTQLEDQQARFVSVHIMFIAFDMAASLFLPHVSRRTLSPTGSQPYQKVLLDSRVVTSFNNLLSKYQEKTLEWVDVVTSQRRTAKTQGIFDVIREASNEALEGTTFCNIASAALLLKTLLNSPPRVEGELLVASLRNRMEEDSKAEKRELRPSDFFHKGRLSDTCIALLCVALISPFTLIMGLALTGKTPVMRALWPFMIWQQIAHLERPEWVKKRERDIIELLFRIAWAGPQEDVWEMIVEMARRWKVEDARDPPRPEDARFFVGLVQSREEKKSEENKKKNTRRKTKSQPQ